MKKFKYAIGIAAMALFGACSSDAPEIIDNPVDDGETGMYVTINLKGQPTTRAGVREAEPYEKVINKIQIFISNGTITVDKIIDNTDKVTKDDGTETNCIDGSTVTFTVDNTTFNEMKAAAATDDWEILLYVNGADTDYSGIMYGSTDGKTWSVENFDGDGQNTHGGFAMSNAAEVKVKLNAPSNDAGTKYSKAWSLTGDIQLSRLATRFDYASTNKSEYTLLSQNNVKLSIDGMAVNTFATNTFRIAHYSSTGNILDGKTNADGCTHFTNNNDFTNLFRVTDVYVAGTNNVENPASYKSTNLHYVLNSSKTTIYARPNTIGNGVDPTFLKAPYTAIRAKIDMPDAGDGSSFKKHEKLYAMNGIIIGGARDLKALKESGEKFKLTVGYTAEDNLTTEEKTKISDAIAYVEKHVQEYIDGHNFNALSTAAEMTEENDNIKTFLKAEEYSYSNSNGLDGYYTYYGVRIQHSEMSNNAWKYGVSRNLVYELGVKYFTKLGNNGSGKPGTGPGESKVQDMLLNLTCEVLDWELNQLNSSLKL